MRIIRIFAATLARFFISAIFLASAVKNVLNWGETEQTLMNTLADWQGYSAFWDQAQDLFTFLTPWAPLLLVIGTILSLAGGLLLLLGIKEKLAATLLFLFMIPATILYHSFWFYDGPARDLQSIMFLKNLAILGSLILVMLHGAQARSGGGEDGFPPIKLG